MFIIIIVVVVVLLLLEHGVGTGKKKYLEAELGEASVNLMKTLKRALDPDAILNPGKIVDV